MFRLIQKYSNKLFLVLASLLVVSGICVNMAHALTYTQGVGLSFTFDPSISVTLSSSDLIIPNLVAGTASDSNIINVNVKTNSAVGYALNATVGNNTTFNTRDLIHQTSTVTDKFSSVNFGTIVATNTALSDNTWGYSYSLDNGMNWIAKSTSGTSSGYSGLPLYSDTTNIATLRYTTGPVEAADGDDIKFKIAARASNGITSGEYNNVINFTAVANPLPKTLTMAYEDAGKTKLNGYYKMQDMSTAICDAADLVDEDSQMQAIDIRDNKIYWITKLRDGKCWMTQNLDHDIDTNFAYTPANTDIPANWVPDKSTYATGVTMWNLSGEFIQQSYDPGSKIWDGTFSPNISSITLDNMPQGTNTHYHIGNYYNWGAAIAMDNTNTYVDDGIDANQSICPAGWTLPKSGNSASIGSFRFMLNQYGLSGNHMSNPYIWDAPLYFPISGYWNGQSNCVAYYGYFWSSTIEDADIAYSLFASVDYIAPNSASYRYTRSDGFNVRCVSR